MADNLRLGSLLFLCVLWVIISSASSNQDCLHDEDIARETGRNCSTNRRCSPDESVCRGNRDCLCDGACGYRCISTRKTPFCKELEPPVNGSVVYSTGSQAFGSVATYVCNQGFGLSSEGLERTCMGDGEWSQSEMPQCVPKVELCPRLQSVNSTCHQACALRAECDNKRVEDCLCEGDCGMSCLPVYVSGYCPEVESEGVVVVSMTTKRIVYRSQVTLDCDDTHEVENGSKVITCLINGTWSSQPLRCRPKAACDSPPVIEGASLDRWDIDLFYPGDELIYTCSPGYDGRVRTKQTSCREDLSWTPITMDCYPKSCGYPGRVQNGGRRGNLFTFLSKVTFYCNSGYELIGYPYRTCLSNQQWTGFLPSCKPVKCPELHAPEHGTMQGTSFTYDSEVYLECDYGYKMIGSGRRRCQGDKSWSGEETTCRVITCPEPDPPLHGSKITPRYGLDAIARFSCDDGYTLSGSRTSRCTEEETWTQPTPQCQAQCAVLSPPEYGYYAAQRYRRFSAGDVVEHGTVIQIICRSWYSLNSDEEYTCTNGHWSFDAECVATPCVKLPDLPNGLVEYNPVLVNQSLPTVPHETQVTYSCLHGFELQDTHGTPIRCHFGRWNDNTEPVCSPKPCSRQDLDNGRVRYTKNNEEFSVRNQVPHHGVSRTFKCSNGYSLDPAKMDASACIDGVWNTPLPACVPDSCSQPPAVDGGTIQVQNMRHGGTVWVTCDGEQLKPSVGGGQLSCHAGRWVPDGIMCISRDAPSNVAYRRPASQSSTSDESDRQASLAVDGDRNVNSAYGSCTTARKSGSQLFWEVDLQAVYRIEHVDIYVKRKSKLSLNGATIQVGYPGNTRESYRQCGLTITSEGDSGSKPYVRVHCNLRLVAGQIVRIELQEAKRLSLCEVEVFATGPIRTCRIPYIASLSQTLEGDSEVLPSNAQFPPETRIVYRCEAGYQRNGAVDNLCKKDGTWAHADPTCDAADCEVENPRDGQLTQRIKSIRHTAELAYTCNDGYEKENKVTRCESGKLTPGPPKCVPQRCRLQASGLSNVMINNRELEPDSEGTVYIPHNTLVNFGCRRGYELTNNNRYTPRCWEGDLRNFTSYPACYAVRCPYPPSLTHGSYRFVQGNRYEHGSTIRYECNPGYTLQHSTTDSHCDNGQWSRQTAPVCQPDEVGCHDPPFLTHGSYSLVQGNRYEHGSTIRYECNPGYTLQDSTTDSRCDNGRWTRQTAPVCQPDEETEPLQPVGAALCPTPSVPNALIYHQGHNIAWGDYELIFVQGDVIEVRCNRDFRVNGSKVATSTCLYGAWTPELSPCEVTYKRSCSRPEEVHNVKQYYNGIKLADRPRTMFYDESSIISRCKDPLTNTLVAGSHRMCLDGRWTGSVPQCVRSPTSFRLPGLYNLLHQYMANGTLLIYPGVGELSVDCIVPGGHPVLDQPHWKTTVPNGNGRKKYGPPKEGHSGTYMCRKFGHRTVLHLLQIQVRAVSCSEPRPLLNGRRIGDDFRLTRSVLFECDEGYDLIGDRKIKCNLGEWLGDVPECRARDCPEINMADLDPNLLLQVNEGTSPGSRAIFTCQSGFHRVGETHLTCQGGRWSSSFPTCEADIAAETNPLFHSDNCNCEVWQRCVVDSSGQPACHCIHPSQCASAAGQEVVCGSDGRTYLSFCRMKAASCLLDLDVDVDSSGPCPETTEDPDEEDIYMSSEFSESSLSVDSTTEAGSWSSMYCQTCVTQDLATACQNSTHVFVAVPKYVEPAQSDGLNYSVMVVNPLKGYRHPQDITFLLQGTLDETNQCHCPSVTLGSDSYLFVLQEESPTIFQIANGFVGLWADHSETYNTTKTCC